MLYGLHSMDVGHHVIYKVFPQAHFLYYYGHTILADEVPYVLL